MNPAEQFRQELVASVRKGDRVTLRWSLDSGYVRASEGKPSVAVISTGQVDRYNTTLAPDGWDLKQFRKNPVVLWAHMRGELPIANSAREFVEGSKLKAELDWVPADLNPWAGIVKRFYDEEYLHGWSVGFIPTKIENPDAPISETLHFLEQELVEFSAVPVPANPGALMEGLAPADYAVQASALMRSFGDITVQTGPGQFRVVPKEAVLGVIARPWDREKALERVTEWAGGKASRMSKAFAVECKDILLHHDVAEGNLITVWNGVQEAMLQLMDTGWATLSEAGVREAWAHLAGHYKQFGSEAPSLEAVLAKHSAMLELIESYRGTEETDMERAGTGPGKVLRRTNRDKLEQAGRLIQEVLDSASGDDDEDEDEEDEEKGLGKGPAPTVDLLSAPLKPDAPVLAEPEHAVELEVPDAEEIEVEVPGEE